MNGNQLSPQNSLRKQFMWSTYSKRKYCSLYNTKLIKRYNIYSPTFCFLNAPYTFVMMYDECKCTRVWKNQVSIKPDQCSQVRTTANMPSVKAPLGRVQVELWEMIMTWFKQSFSIISCLGVHWLMPQEHAEVRNRLVIRAYANAGVLYLALHLALLFQAQVLRSIGNTGEWRLRIVSEIHTQSHFS